MERPAPGSYEHDGDFQQLEGPCFGRYGGQWMPESLMAALQEVEETFRKAIKDPEFIAELNDLNTNYINRPSLLTEAPRFAQDHPGVRIFLKREDLNHTGSHKINNVIGQALLAKRMGKTRLIAETGAGQHGVATATAAALFGLECTVYMGEADTKRQALNVARMEMLGAEVKAVTIGARTLKDAINEALRDWVASVDTTHYLLGTVTGPAPFPEMVRYFHQVIGDEAREQSLEQTGKLPDAVIACVGGGSNAIGLFHGFLDDKNVQLYGMEAGGAGVETGKHAAPIALGRVGVLHGARTYLMQDEDGQNIDSHSITEGLDYPGVGPQHAFLHDTGRAIYQPVSDSEAMDAFKLLTRSEGIMPAIESSHALAGALRLAAKWVADGVVDETTPQDEQKVIIVNLSGRGDKDVSTAATWFGMVPEDHAEAGE
ncbi:MAG: tryptophan synthase subunit beta [Yaniella sp.]|nr:tryptophan synthase subunit beta [Yaniella sp.]